MKSVCPWKGVASYYTSRLTVSGTLMLPGPPASVFAGPPYQEPRRVLGRRARDPH
ncbi:MAG: hypothetical protein ABI899_07875 [Actinomycetota bacterium]